MRESLFEKLKSRELSYIDEFQKIYNLTFKECSTTNYYFESAFKKSPYNVFYEDFYDGLLDIFENDKEYFNLNINTIDGLIKGTKQIQSQLTLDSFLDYLEFFATLFKFNNNVRYYGENVDQIKKIIFNDIDKLGYQLIEDGDTKTYRAMLKNPIAESTALNVKKSTRCKIYKYLMIRNGKIEEKRECIKSLADDVESICKKYSNIFEYDKLKQFIQCVRHTKDTPKKEFSFYYEDEEKWLNKIFDMIIGVLAFTQTKEIAKEIISYEKK